MGEETLSKKECEWCSHFCISAGATSVVRGDGPIAILVGVGVSLAARLGTEDWYRILQTHALNGDVAVAVEEKKVLLTPILPSRSLDILDS